MLLNLWNPGYPDIPYPFRVVTTLEENLLAGNFKKTFSDFGIKDVPTTSRNPAANGACEQMHQTVANVLRTLVHTVPPRTLNDAKGMVDGALATALHAIRANVSTVSGYSPGALAFHRDMLLDVPIVVDLVRLRDKRQLAVDEKLRRINSKRISYDYQPGQKHLKKKHEWTKLGERWDGPYIIEKTHVNGNVTVKLTEGVTERLNIRRNKPYRSA